MKSNSFELSDLVIGRDGAALSPPITLTLAPGEMLVVRGSNGSGKSTLLKILAGLLPPHSGSFGYAAAPPGAGNEPGRGPTPPSIAPLYLGHKRGLTPTMSVYDNVAFWAHAYGYPELTPTALHYFDLGDVADAPLGTLSAGWQQRVALTRLLTIQSPLWLLDEPLANLDTEGLALLQSLAQSRLEQGGIIILTSHTEIHGKSIKTININEINKEIKVMNEIREAI